MKNDPRELAREGAGWEDLRVLCGISEGEARFIVFGFEAFKRWKAKQESKAS